MRFVWIKSYKKWYKISWFTVKCNYLTHEMLFLSISFLKKVCILIRHTTNVALIKEV